MKGKFYYGVLKERNGNYEYEHPCRFEHDGDPEVYLNGLAARWYGDDKEELDAEDNCYYFNGGEVAVKAASVREISRETFDSLEGFITQL